MPKPKKFNREHVLTAASSVFRQKGYNGTSIDELLVATGLSRSSLYDTFRDKHTLYLESLQYYRTATQNGVETLNGKHIDGYRKIECLFKEAVNTLTGNPSDNGCLMVNAAAELGKHCDQTAKVVGDNKEKMKEILTDWVNDARAHNKIKVKGPAGEYGSFLFNTLCGLKVLSQSGASKKELDTVVKVTMEALV
jgi:TetR/AcrR family transcriptional repressor of nem operon